MEEELEKYQKLLEMSEEKRKIIALKKNIKIENIKWYDIIKFVETYEDIKIQPLPKNMDELTSTNYGLYGITIRNKKSFILYNNKTIKERQNFTIMHEIAHCILHDNKKTETYTSLIIENEYSEEDLIKEKEANMLAGMLLINKKILITLLHEKKPFNYLKKYFNVSAKALDTALFNHFYFQTIAQILNEEKAIDKPYIYCRKTINNYRYNNHQLIIK
ncbi:ImmA/IrrE family metallo-endopeptidase [Leuconostoc citreum]|uniref:ImmA/IrrE family metallo-endopeptidase n=1 Tax=Leuconostoc citreum TaxID=33964 RepID=UPI0032DFD180